MNYALEVNGLTKDYGSFKLDSVSFSLPGGAIMGLIGENGAGKTTTLSCILGLVRPDGGSVRLLDGAHPGGSSQALEELGVVLDESTFHDTLCPADVDRILSRVYKRWDSPLFTRYLDRFSLPRKKMVKEFSRGMKMKLSLAAALAHHPRLLVLDEATSGLDPVVRTEILDEFLAFIQDEDHSILLSSHITSDLEKVADYVTYLHEGKVTLTGERDALLISHGRLICSREDLAAVDSSLLAGARISQFSCEALVRNRSTFCARYPKLTVEPVTLEDLMVLTARGNHL